MPSVARNLGRYRLVALLAQGGMGDVWLALQHGPAGFTKLVVLKELRSTFLQDASFLTMFHEEARISARLAHPHVVQTYEVDEDNGTYFIAMEFLDGHSLQRMRRRARERRGPIPIALELTVMLATLHALEYAHDFLDYDGTPLHIVHRDVSPQNILITFDGQVKLLDFGIAKALDSSDETRTGTIKGKLAYMSPEQARGESVDHRTDLFAVGVLLAEAVTGRRFWPRMSEAKLFMHLVQGELPNYRELAGAVPEELLAVCDRALAVDPDARYATAGEMRVDLEAVIARDPELRAERAATAQMLAELFVEEREKVRACIDACVRAQRAEQALETSLPIPSLAALTRESASISTPQAASTSEGDHPSSLAPLSSTMVPPPDTKNSSVETSSPRDISIVVSFRPATARVAIAAVAVGAILGGALYVSLRSSESVQPAAAAWTGTPSAPDGPHPPMAVDAASPTTSPSTPSASASALVDNPDLTRAPVKPRAPAGWTPPRAAASATLPPPKRTDLDIRLSR